MVLPYLKGLIIILCGFFYLALWIYCVFSICGDYIGRSIFGFLTSGIRALSRAGVVGNYFLFLQIFFSEKRAATFQKFSVYFGAKFVEKGCISEFLSEKHPS